MATTTTGTATTGVFELITVKLDADGWQLANIDVPAEISPITGFVSFSIPSQSGTPNYVIASFDIDPNYLETLDRGKLFYLRGNNQYQS